MKHLLHQSRLEHLIHYRNGYLLLALSSFVLNGLLLLSLWMMAGRERIILVPPQIEKPLWITQNKVSPEYLHDVSLFFANLRLSLTASNASAQRETLLRYVSPKLYNDLKFQLIDEGERLKKNHISTAFFPVEVKVDTQQLISRITGDLQSTVGQVQLPSNRVIYKIAFSYESGRLQVKSFEEVSKNG